LRAIIVTEVSRKTPSQVPLLALPIHKREIFLCKRPPDVNAKKIVMENSPRRILFSRVQFFHGIAGFRIVDGGLCHLSVPMALALCVALRRTDQSLAAIYLALSLVGAVSFIVARPAFEMLALSQQYAAATTDTQKVVLLAAGETLVAIFHGTTFQVSYILGSINGLILSMIMLRSNVFSKATAYSRITSSVLGFGIFVPTIGLYLSLFSVLSLLI
jgi:hypothetical protein